jgi:hypothetical protein
MAAINKTVQTLFLVVILCAFISTLNYAQDRNDTLLLKTKKRLPVLNGFRFMPTDLVKDPFVNTYFKVSAGNGLAIDLQSYVRNFKGTVIDTISGDLTYVQGEVELQYAVNDWLSFNGSYGGAGRLGSNTFTILTAGVSYTTGYSLGSTFRLINKEKFALSGNAEFSDTKVFMYSIYDYIKRAVQNSGDTTFHNDLLTEDLVLKLFMNVNAAYAPYNWLGILGSTGFGLGRPFQQRDRGNFKVALAGSVDFLNVKHINFPIGVLASLKYSAFSETGENADNVFVIGLRLGYTGHKDFDVGVEATYSKLNYRKTDEQIKSIQTNAKVRYYF